jgi:pilus assembly protein CpaF
MTLMAGMELPVSVIREQITSALDVIVHQSRLRDGTRHVTHITEVLGLDNSTIVMQDIFAFDFNHDPGNGPLGRLVPTGLTPQFREKLNDRGVEIPDEVLRAG